MRNLKNYGLLKEAHGKKWVGVAATVFTIGGCGPKIVKNCPPPPPCPSSKPPVMRNKPPRKPPTAPPRSAMRPSSSDKRSNPYEPEPPQP